MSTVTRRGKLPAPSTVLGVLDEQAKLAGRRAINVDVAETRDQAPRSDRGGQHLADQFSGRVTKTKTGYAAKADFGRRRDHRGVTAAQVARWVTRGTGLFREGPGSKHKIHAKNRLKRMNLGNGVLRWSVRGQKPNQFVTRARDLARGRAQAEIDLGAVEAARILREKGIER